MGKLLGEATLSFSFFSFQQGSTQEKDFLLMLILSILKFSVANLYPLRADFIYNFCPVKGEKANIADTNQMPHNTGPDKDLHCGYQLFMCVGVPQCFPPF